MWNTTVKLSYHEQFSFPISTQNQADKNTQTTAITTIIINGNNNKKKKTFAKKRITIENLNRQKYKRIIILSWALRENTTKKISHAIKIIKYVIHAHTNMCYLSFVCVWNSYGMINLVEK